MRRPRRWKDIVADIVLKERRVVNCVECEVDGEVAGYRRSTAVQELER